MFVADDWTEQPSVALVQHMLELGSLWGRAVCCAGLHVLACHLILSPVCVLPYLVEGISEWTLQNTTFSTGA